MPNYVKNILSVENCNEKRFDQICAFVKSDETLFDFNKIIPMPEDLNLEEGSANDFFKNLFLKYCGRHGYPELCQLSCGIKEDEIKHAKSYIETRDEQSAMSDLDILREAMRRGKQYIENKDRYGAETWYCWRYMHWGTKWNDDVIIPEGTMAWEFRTAWTSPIPVIRMLSLIFPEVRFVLQYADEDLGQNCGLVEFLDGVETNFDFTSEEKAYAFACGLWDVDPEEDEDEDDEDDEEEDCFPGCDDDYPMDI